MNLQFFTWLEMQSLCLSGLAWVYWQYCHHPICESWKNFQIGARMDKRGLWADPERIPPWEFRRKKRRKWGDHFTLDVVINSQEEKCGVCNVYSVQKTDGAVCPVRLHRLVRLHLSTSLDTRTPCPPLHSLLCRSVQARRSYRACRPRSQANTLPGPPF